MDRRKIRHVPLLKIHERKLSNVVMYVHDQLITNL